MRRLLVYMIALISIIGCVGTPKSVELTSQNIEVQTPESDAKFNQYITTYWYGFNFRDTLNLRPEVIERPFARYLTVLPQATDSVRHTSLTSLLDSAAVNPQSLQHVISLSEKYLYSSSSPMRHEELYIDMLNAIIANPSIDDLLKIRPQYQLTAAMKNRVSTIATNFEITLVDGSITSLHDVEAKYTLLLFNNPECAECRVVQEAIISNHALLKARGVSIVAIYPDSDLEAWRGEEYPQEWINGYNTSLLDNGLYHLQAIPTLYLLDSKKRVLLKDVSIDHILLHI